MEQSLTEDILMVKAHAAPHFGLMELFFGTIQRTSNKDRNRRSFHDLQPPARPLTRHSGNMDTYESPLRHLEATRRCGEPAATGSDMLTV